MNGDTRLSKALDAHPEMRRFMAPRITLRRVAAMAGIPEADLLARINHLTGEEREEPSETTPLPPRQQPAWAKDLQTDTISWGDVTPQDDALTDPLPPIVAGWKALRPGETVRIEHRWEPQPLYDVWEKLGQDYWAE